MNLTLITDSAPDDEPVLFHPRTEGDDGMYDYLRLDEEADKNTVIALTRAARRVAETYTGRELTRKTWELSLDNWPLNMLPYSAPFWGTYGYPGVPAPSPLGPYVSPQIAGEIRLLDPLVSVTSVIYRDAAGAYHTLTEGTDYVVDTSKHPGAIYPPPDSNWPGDSLWPTGAIRIRFLAGMTSNGVGSLTATAGSGYAEDDVLNLPGTYPCTISLTSINGSGRPTGWDIQDAGVGFSLDSGDVAATGGSGTGATFTITSLRDEVQFEWKLGIKRLVAQWHEQRIPFEAVRYIAELPFDVSVLFGSDRLHKF